MKLAKTLFLFVALLTPVTAIVAAEDSTDATQSVETLRLQLLEVESKQANLEARAKQLDEDLKPENIERSLAGIGSTKPEELREYRRRQLSIERESVRKQLSLLANSRERLENTIRTAEGVAYQQSAEGFASPQNKTMMLESAGGVRWTFFRFSLSSLVALLGIVFVVALVLWSYRARSLDRN